MQHVQHIWTEDEGWDSNEHLPDADLVLVFGAPEKLKGKEIIERILTDYRSAEVVIASTAGEISQTSVSDDTVVATALRLEDSQIKVAQTQVNHPEMSREAGSHLAELLPDRDKLRHMIVLSDGQTVNGSQLVAGLNSVVGEDIGITGGLAGDADRFEETLVGRNAMPSVGQVVGIGFYGDGLQIGYDSYGGWDTFGPERTITRSEENVLYELDGKSALDLYKLYLGDKAEGLPASALLFPLSIRTDTQARPIVRTILNIDEDDKSMIFAGDIPEGAKARLMKANFERIIDGAGQAAEESANLNFEFEPELALLISCVGRKLILGQRVEEEVERVAETIGGDPVITGFYSYGEIAPFSDQVKCDLHNQTMTVTLLSEKKGR